MSAKFCRASHSAIGEDKVQRSGMSTRTLCILGNPENRRVALFQSALKAAGWQRVIIISWLDWLRGKEGLPTEAGSILRIESPGENHQVECELLALGANSPDRTCPNAQRITATTALSLAEDRGLIRAPRQWYLGFCQALTRLSQEWQSVYMNSPKSIAVSFDKARVHSVLAKKQVPVPCYLGSPQSYDELRALLESTNSRRVFVKPRHGSSASGVVALTVHKRRQLAITSAEIVTENGAVSLYNSLRMRRYTEEQQLRPLFDALCREGVVVEKWIPKLGLGLGSCDLRILVIDGVAQHCVVRQSRNSPITNLHLGNQRGDLEAFRRALGAGVWQQSMATAENASKAICGLHYAGVDLMVEARGEKCFILELNAFGDLIPNLKYKGLDTYGAEIAAL
jgi:glutathione synthase/RimK-type ligase-like ATP-grasp enzyme